MKLKLLLLLTLAASRLAAQEVPTSACLASVEGVCIECDTANFYFLQFGACQRFQGLHCASISQSGACLSCEPGFLLSKSETCIYVENRVLNCSLYSDENNYVQCVSCSAGFILVRGLCFPETQNCQTYFPGRSRCQVCKEGFQLARNRIACEPVDAASAIN